MLLLALMLAAAMYLGSCFLWPFTNCAAGCEHGKCRSPSGTAWRECRSCHGTGRRRRAGAVVLGRGTDTDT